MPTISMFLGILIKMNWQDTGQHSLPHFHAFYGDYEAVFWARRWDYCRKIPRQAKRIYKSMGADTRGRVSRQLEACR